MGGRPARLPDWREGMFPREPGFVQGMACLVQRGENRVAHIVRVEPRGDAVVARRSRQRKWVRRRVDADMRQIVPDGLYNLVGNFAMPGGREPAVEQERP